MRAWMHRGLAALLCSAAAASCLAQSLGDVARQERERKSHISAPAHVYTNDEIPSRPPGDSAWSQASASSEGAPSTGAPAKPSADEVRAKVRKQQQKVHDLEARLADIQRQLDQRASVGMVTTPGFVMFPSMSPPGYCTMIDAMYAASAADRDWCDQGVRLLQEQDEVQARLQKEQSALEDLQEQARRMGFRSAVYDPD